MSTFAYPPVYLAYFLLQAVSVAGVAFSYFDSPQAWPFFLLWATGLGAALVPGRMLARRSYVPAGAIQIAPLAVAGIVLWLWIVAAGSIYIFSIVALGLLLGRNMLLTTRRALYFDIAIVLTLFYNAIGSPYLPHPWPFAIAFLLALLLLLILDYADRRLTYVHAGGTGGSAEFLPGLRNAAFATALVLAVAAPLYRVLPQPEYIGLALLPGSAPARGTYDNPGWFGPGQPSKGGAGKSGRASGESSGRRTSVPPRLDVSRSDGGRAGGQSGIAGEAAGASATAPLLLLYMDADRPLYLRTRAYVVPQVDGWLESPQDPVLRRGRGYFLLSEGSSRGQVRQRFKVAALLDDRIPVAYRPRQVAFPAPGMQWSHDLTLQAPANLVPDTEYGAYSGLQYLGERPGGDAELSPSSAYVIVPMETSPRTRALAQSIVETRSTPRERAEALEAYLRGKYQRGPFHARADASDPTAQFLFEHRQGGSAQFSNALAIMLRSAGIPARIVGGYRARRLNPLHGDYEVWSTDMHYWVEAWLEVGWVTFEPSPWAALPARNKPDTTFAAAREYVRLAKELPDPAPDGEPVAAPDIPSWYLKLVLVWGWLATYGIWLLLALAGVAGALWRWRRLLRPLQDAVDRWRLRHARRRSPVGAVIAGFAIVERICARRGLARAATENHAEYLARLAGFRPWLRAQIGLLAAVFAAARYGADGVTREDAARTAVACEEIAELIDGIAMSGSR